MAKDPAFLFYPGDWLGGTMTMSRHLKGCYIDLLIAQFNNGPLSLDSIRTILGQDQASWTVLSSKFKQTPEGLWYNERLVTEIEKRKNFSEKQKQRVSKRWEKSQENDTELYRGIYRGITKELGITIIENENRNENQNLILRKEGVGENPSAPRGRPAKKVKKPLPVIFRESEFFEKERLAAALFGTQYQEASIDYYHEAMLNWSDSKQNKKIDWLATAKNFMMRDMNEGKFKTKTFNPKANATHQRNSGSKPVAENVPTGGFGKL